MKQLPFADRSSKQAGFTLVELLVVIGIIAILAGVLLSAGGSALRAAQRAKAANLATQIQTAATAYYTEYSVYPVPTSYAATGDMYISDSDTTDWPLLIEGLSGNLSPANPATVITSTTTGLNTRGIAFLSLKSTDVTTTAPVDCPKNPLPYQTANSYFNLVMDTDYSGITGDTGNGKALMPDFVKSTNGNILFLPGGTTAGIAVWANCNTTAATTWNPGFFVHTY